MMVSLRVSTHIKIWLCLPLLSMVGVWFYRSIDLGRVSGIRALANTGSLLPIPDVNISRGGRHTISSGRLCGRLCRNLLWFRRLSSDAKFAPVRGYKDEGVCPAGFLTEQYVDVPAAWRLPGCSSLISRRHHCPAGSGFSEDSNQAEPDQCSSELLRHNIARVKYGHCHTWPAIFGAVAASPQGWSWHPASKPWQRRALPFGLSLYYREAGGGGDCMYHSVAAALLEVKDNVPSLSGYGMKELRIAGAEAIVGDSLLNDSGSTPKEETEFLSRLEIFAALEAGGSWMDPWSPTTILKHDEYKNSEGVTMTTKTPQQKAQALYFELSRPGGSHWGTAQDLMGLEQKLNIGFVVLHEKGYIYPLGVDRSSRKLAYVLLYFRAGGHFQQAGIAGPTSTGPRSAFQPAEVPDFLHCVHLVDCHVPVYPTEYLGYQFYTYEWPRVFFYARSPSQVMCLSQQEDLDAFMWLGVELVMVRLAR